MSGNYNKEFEKAELVKPHLSLTAELVHLLVAQSLLVMW